MQKVGVLRRAFKERPYELVENLRNPVGANCVRPREDIILPYDKQWNFQQNNLFSAGAYLPKNPRKEK